MQRTTMPLLYVARVTCSDLMAILRFPTFETILEPFTRSFQTRWNGRRFPSTSVGRLVTLVTLVYQTWQSSKLPPRRPPASPALPTCTDPLQSSDCLPHFTRCRQKPLLTQPNNQHTSVPVITIDSRELPPVLDVEGCVMIRPSIKSNIMKCDIIHPMFTIYY